MQPPLPDIPTGEPVLLHLPEGFQRPLSLYHTRRICKEPGCDRGHACRYMSQWDVPKLPSDSEGLHLH